ncbi:MAG: hypothetical protein ACXADX_01680, partial [Candidatus Hodarchaeales archaeon]
NNIQVHYIRHMGSSRGEKMKRISAKLLILPILVGLLFISLSLSTTADSASETYSELNIGILPESESDPTPDSPGGGDDGGSPEAEPPNTCP